MIARKLTLILLLITGACIDPLQVDVKTSQPRLIVDGLITDQEGPYQVKLFYSVNLSTSVGINFTPVENATVEIVDQDGNRTPMGSYDPGIYKTFQGALTGQVGNSYYLYVKTKDGKEYTCEPQVLKTSGEVKSIYFEFEKDALPGETLGKTIDGLKVFADAKGEEGSDNLYRWRWTTINKVKTFPELRVYYDKGGNEHKDPEPCSGYVARNNRLIRVGDCECCLCWTYNYSGVSKVSKIEFVSDFEFDRLNLGTIPATSMEFYDRYYIEVEQLSLSDEAYEYWNLIQKQQEGATDIFQPNSIRIKGNMKCISNEDEEVLGFFGVSGVVSNSVFIEPSVVPFVLPPIDTIKRSCLEYYKYPTTQKPSFW